MGSKKKRNKNSKTGVNDPCPCGSGFKYKKCHLNDEHLRMLNPNAPLEVIDATKRFNNPPFETFEQSGFLLGRPFIDTLYGANQRARAVGNSVYLRPARETFQEFLLDIFGKSIGYDWIAEERKKPRQDRNQLALWGEELVAVAGSHKEKTDNKSFGIIPTGNIKTLLAMAFDYYSLSHCHAKVQPNFIKRLKNNNNFQGAKYEMAVAGIAVRAGFEITWVNSKSKHCEFIGKHKRTGDEVYFECKSHHRDGVLGMMGEFNPENAKVKVLNHIDEAIEQTDNKLPLIIFNDINLPTSPNVEFEEISWVKQTEETFKKFGFYEKYKNTNYGALFMTNFSWHFFSDLNKTKRNEVVSYWHIGGRYSINPECISLLKIASEQYGFVPPRLEEIEQFGKPELL